MKNPAGKNQMAFLAIVVLCLSKGSIAALPGQRTFGTSLYYAPFALIHFDVGPSARGGIEQELGKRFSIFAEGSRSLRRSSYYKDLDGYKLEGGVKYSFDEHDGNVSEWLSVSAGKLNHSFSQKGKLYRPDTIIDIGIKRLRRVAEFFHLGIGCSIYDKSGFYFEQGLQVGLRHRDLDVEGMDEEKDNEFKVSDLHSDGGHAAMQSTDMWVPDFAITLRVGYRFNPFSPSPRFTEYFLD